MSKTNYLRKRVLALLLALTMCLSLVQVTAFASEGEEQANVAITDTAEQDTDASAVEEDDENTSNVEETNGDISQEEGANEDISGEEESNEDTSDEKGLGEETSEEEEANEEASEEEESEEDASEEETPADDTLVCICETKCGEGSVKEDCPVCGAEDADLTACEGEEVPAEVPAQVQEFLYAVAALPAPEDIPEEATAEEIEALSAKIDACEATFNALSDENMEREDVQAALVIIGAVVNAFAGIQVLENSNTLEYPYEYTEGDITYELHEDGTATVTSGSATNGKIDIPATVTCEGIEHRVTAIGDKAFYQTSGSEFYAEITLPEGLEIIGEYAFNKVYLTNEVIHIPDSVTTIKKQAFCYFNDGANGAYVQKIVLGDGVRTIDSFAFYTSNTTQKLAVECGINIETFDKSAFYNKSPFNVSSVTVDGPKYSMDTVLKKVTALKPLVTAGTIQYTQGIDTNNINSITLLREAITTSEGPTTLTIMWNYFVRTGKTL